MENKKTKIKTGKVRFSYANVWEPRSISGGGGRYSVSLIIPKSDKSALAKIKDAIETVKKDAISRFGGKIPDGLKLPLRDGDIERADDETYANSYFINASSMIKPGIVDKDLKPITDTSDFYSGCYGRASILFYAYSSKDSKGIGCVLHNLQKLEDGERLDSRCSPEEDFGPEEDDLLS